MGNRLLLADDSITIQKVVAIIFANEEFELTVVDNGIAALSKARETRPDVMLVDALMPGKSGYEVCAELRRDPELSSTPILLLIGAFEPFDEEKARSCGADASITKPFESQQLIDRVKELLELGKQRSVAAASAPAPCSVENAAEELWGDLSSFDTMPPAAAAAPFVPAAPARSGVPAAAAAPVAPPVAAIRQPSPPDTWGEAVVEASFEDDLWGAFELDEVPQRAPAPAPPFAEAEFEAEEFFSFEDESEVIEETGAPVDLGAAVEVPSLYPSAEELFSLADEVPPGAEPFPLPQSCNVAVEEPFSSEPERVPEAELSVAPVAPLAPAPPAAGAFFPWEASPVQAEEPPQVQAVHPAFGPFSEADLVAALSQVSREVIERIVWEVVPDLAEVLIKEEIRKLRAGIKE